jgi:hypothetical protein
LAAFLLSLAPCSDAAQPVWELELFNADDVMQAFVNGKLVATQRYMEPKVRISIDPYIRLGTNEIVLELANLGSTPASYGYAVYNKGQHVVLGRCGEARSPKTHGCEKVPQSAGIVWRQTEQFTYDAPPLLLELERTRDTTQLFARVRGSEGPHPSGHLYTGCILGKLYVVDSIGTDVSTPPSVRGRYLSDTLELPFRNNASQISAIPVGTYRGFLRRSTHGWRLELQVPGRGAIQIHLGNTPDHSMGCILVGENAKECAVDASGAAMTRLRSEFAELLRPLVLRISNSDSAFAPPQLQFDGKVPPGAKPPGRREKPKQAGTAAVK